MELFKHVHRRYNILTGEWVKVSPHRTQRPWQGAQESPPTNTLPMHDPDCYLCPGNKRACGNINPEYSNSYSFVNDFAAIIPETEPGNINESSLLQAHNERGLCKVICFSPRHDLTLPRMSISSIRNVIDLWCKEYVLLGELDYINYVQIFENHGSAMGCSNPHPHGQIWSEEFVPDLPAKESAKMSEYYNKHKRTILEDYNMLETAKQSRVIFSNSSFTVLVPFWAVWPFETMIIPHRPIPSIDQMTNQEKDDLADAMKRLGIRYDNLFKTDFPYSMGIHQKPTDKKEHPEWHFHLHYMPPLLRSAEVKKFMVGYELMAMPQRDITAESAASLLQQQSEIHYLEEDIED
ncbi:MAG: UDP-glucose--hexose-1-phosphate uridylyltransferase [Spirochaetes bacterium]|jgi:UDPglucose--hexose-1-phosphate uridylyltransferase|nr:UDP-glucose--hexose-1-phosphate uridylyltransferase [Spirochaetota bacterium]